MHVFAGPLCLIGGACLGEGDSRIAPTGEGKGQPRGIDSRGRGSSRLKSVVVSRWFVVGGEVCLRSLAGRRDGGVGGVGWGWTYATDWQCGASPRSYFESLSTSGPPEGMDSGSGGWDDG